MSNLIEQCHEKKRQLDALRPLSPEQEARILQKFRLDWNYHSNHLEGNSLTYGETKALILHGLTAQGKPLQDHFEMTGHNEAIHWVEDLVKQKAPLTEQDIRGLNQLILKEDHYIQAATADGQPTRIFVEVGKYKTTPNHVQTITGETLFFSTPMETPQHMQELMTWYRESTDDPILKAAYFHYRFIRIHPFTDGNGRVARLLMNFILMMAGYPPVIIKTQEKDAYFSALRLADSGNVEGFVDYIAAGLLQSLDLMIRGAKGDEIEEPDDADKELALLRQRFQSSGRDIHLRKSREVLEDLWKKWMKGWLLAFASETRKFEDFYLSAQWVWMVNNSGSNVDWNQLFERLASPPDMETQTLAVGMTYRGLKKVGLEQHSFNSYIQIRFTDTQYFIGDSFNTDNALPFGYDESPSDEVLRDLLAEQTKKHTKFIAQILDTTASSKKK